MLWFCYLSSVQARNICNKPIINRDPQSLRFEEMQSEIRVSTFLCASSILLAAIINNSF